MSLEGNDSSQVHFSNEERAPKQTHLMDTGIHVCKQCGILDFPQCGNILTNILSNVLNLLQNAPAILKKEGEC